MILLDKFCFGYKANSLLYQNLQLSLETGRIYGLLGKNGAGKSTLLKNLIGLLYPTSGTVSVNGFNPSGRQPSFLRTIYFIPEEVYVPALTINSYVKIFAPFYPAFDRTMFNTYLEKLDLQTDKKLNTLSFGQQKKFIIAFALACNTSVLIMDEPTNGLDIPSKKRFRKLISSSMHDDRIIFISTHQTRDLENLIDQVVIVDNGELVLNAPVEAIGQKLAFKIVEENYNDQPVFYEEELLKGRAVIIENTDGLESQINLEQLFNAATENPVMVKAVFNK